MKEKEDYSTAEDKPPSQLTALIDEEGTLFEHFIGEKGFSDLPSDFSDSETLTKEKIINKFWPFVTISSWKDWKWQRANRLRSITDLKLLLNLKNKQILRYKSLVDTFHYSITPYYLSLIDWSDPKDPIRLQCMPDLKEIDINVVGDSDPLEEEEDMQVPGLVHRYPDRVLALVTSMCLMYCRHCTRKRIWHEGETVRSKKELMAMVEYVKKTPSIREVLISGGDPLTMNIELLDWFLGELRMISHVEVLRIGTRIPVVLPMMITDDLVNMLARHRPLWLNTQFNHPKEITPESQDACDKILRAGIPVSNQSVLLRGINDSVEVMKDLCHSLQRIMVRPYYLFQCDPVTGVEHFRTSIWKGIEIIEMMQGYTGGLCIPTFVVDAPGGGGKIPLQPFYLLSATDRDVVMRNYEGMIIRYFNQYKADFHNINGNGKPEETEKYIKSGKKMIVPQENIRYKRRKQKYFMSKEIVLQ